MISALTGEISELNPLLLQLNVHGVTYEVHISLFSYEEINNNNTSPNITLHTRVIYSETDHKIYGFTEKRHVSIFDFLRSLHGIGPKLAISIMSHLNVEDLIEKLENEEISSLTKIPGIGKAKAQKIMFESNQKKLHLLELKRNATNKTSTAKNGRLEQGNSTTADYILQEALLNLGFQKKEIDRANDIIQKQDQSLEPLNSENIQLWIRLFLKYL